MLKEKLASSIGTAGVIIFYLISLLLTVMPFVILDLSFWIVLIIVAAIFGIPLLGYIIKLGIYVWAFIVAVQSPTDVWIILFYISFGLFIFAELIPLLMNIFSPKGRSGSRN